MAWSLLLAACLLSSLAMADPLRSDRAPEEAAPAKDQSENDREGKFFSVFQIVKFQNEACPTSTGDVGTCYTEAECMAKGGTPQGACASSFGVCCRFAANTCGGKISENNGYIESPNYPSAAPSGLCQYEIEKCDSGVCQYRLVFEDVMLTAPMMGSCDNDTVMVSGVDPVSVSTVPPALCGTLSGQEMYVWVNSTDTPSKILFNVADMTSNSKWKIRVEQVQCSSDNLAPRGCLTYGTTTSGSIMSYNYNSGNGEMINNQKFSHCIKYQDGFCDVAFTASAFDLNPEDSVTIGSNVNSGTAFGVSNMVTLNFTGPYVFPVMSDDMNADMKMGYDIAYMLLPCA